MNELGATWTVVRVTLREGVRRRLLLALAGLSLVAVLITAWGYAQLPHLPAGPNGPLSTPQIQLLASQLLILVMFMFGFVLALAAVFAAAPSLGGELESGEMLAILARPVTRRSVLLGKWLALAIVVVAYAMAATALEYLAIGVTTGYLPPQPAEASLYLAGEGLAILALTMALSTRLPPVTAGIVAMLCFGLAWLGGVVGGIGLAFGDPVTSQLGTVTRLLLPTDGLWRGAIFSLEPAAVVLAGAAAGPEFAAFPFYAAAPPSLAYLAWCAAWIVGMLGAAVVSFGRRDL
jgi:ABC-type transport system involved in multi-copper enzyme maturation permease subunit